MIVVFIHVRVTLCRLEPDILYTPVFWNTLISFYCPYQQIHIMYINSILYVNERSNLMQQYAEMYLLQSHSTYFGRHSAHHQEY